MFTFFIIINKICLPPAIAKKEELLAPGTSFFINSLPGRNTDVMKMYSLYLISLFTLSGCQHLFGNFRLMP
jgi:hypothetical protein